MAHSVCVLTNHGLLGDAHMPVRLPIYVTQSGMGRAQVFTVSAVSSVVAETVTFPADVVKTRLQVSMTTSWSGVGRRNYITYFLFSRKYCIYLPTPVARHVVTVTIPYPPFADSPWHHCAPCRHKAVLASAVSCKSLSASFARKEH